MIKLFDTWLTEENDKPFLIIGKGSTYNLINNINTDQYTTLGLNHVVKNTKVDVAHAIDIEVIDEVGEPILENCRYFVMPWHPNCMFNPSSTNLQQYCEQKPVLKKLMDQGRLLSYNRANGVSPCPLGGISILPLFFSGDTVFQLLSYLGEKNIYSIGVDGGAVYNDIFSDYVPLGNTQESFDNQFLVINDVMRLTGSKLTCIGNLEPINVFVGSQEEQIVPALVLKDSIMRNTHNPVYFTNLADEQVDFRMPKDPRNRPRTPFSFQRFMIPTLANSKGKAFYLDSDMQVFGDMADLLEIPFDDCNVIACSGMDKYEHWKGSEYAFLMLDCENIDWNLDTIVDSLDSGEMNYEELMFDFKMAKVKHAIPPEWNSLDTYEQDITKLLHYTDMNRQPWRFPNHPHKDIWQSGLLDSLNSGVLDRQVYETHCIKGYIRS